MLAAQQKGLEEREGEREIERGEGESGGEGEGEGERGEEGEQEVRTAQSEEKKTTKKEPTSPAQPLTRKFKFESNLNLFCPINNREESQDNIKEIQEGGQS